MLLESVLAYPLNWSAWLDLADTCLNTTPTPPPHDPLATVMDKYVQAHRGRKRREGTQRNGIDKGRDTERGSIEKGHREEVESRGLRLPTVQGMRQHSFAASTTWTNASPLICLRVFDD